MNLLVNSCGRGTIIYLEHHQLTSADFNKHGKDVFSGHNTCVNNDIIYPFRCVLKSANIGSLCSLSTTVPLAKAEVLKICPKTELN